MVLFRLKMAYGNQVLEHPKFAVPQEENLTSSLFHTKGFLEDAMVKSAP